MSASDKTHRVKRAGDRDPAIGRGLHGIYIALRDRVWLCYGCACGGFVDVEPRGHIGQKYHIGYP